MSRRAFTLAVLPLCLLGAGVEASPDEPRLVLRQEAAHPWRPPFGIDRVGRQPEVLIEASAPTAAGTHALVIDRGDGKSRREPLSFPDRPPFLVRSTLSEGDDEVAIMTTANPTGGGKELARLRVRRDPLEVEAIASADVPTNPVDLGAILVPSDWLLLGPHRTGVVDAAALCRDRDLPDAKLKAWFQASPDRDSTAPLRLDRGKRARGRIRMPEATTKAQRDVLHISLEDGHGGELWRKSIPVMLVHEPPRWPRFGATATRLRYDAPISVRDPATGSFSSLDYEKGWKSELQDVVVSLPHGGRFVFWRGSSYIPFWATAHNTGACYEWAEMLSRPADAVDCVEPLMDKDLRYGRVEIVESTAACARVRWSYQSTDLHYQVWGDSAVEEYTFYPDGFGVRSLELKTSPGARYELSEFIILTPQSTYPFDVLPETLVEAIGGDGTKRVFRFPFAPERDDPRKGLEVPAVYRLRPHRDEARSAIYFNPRETQPPPVVFGAFQDRGQVVTPCYWGSHWPLARGNATGSTIDARVALSPCHNSVMSWAEASPTPLTSSEATEIDALGRSRPMQRRRWAWLIGLSDASDARLLQWGRSFATPPSLTLRGATLVNHAPERRATLLRVADRSVAIGVEPRPVCVNPVFELDNAPRDLRTVVLDGIELDPARFAWDGRRLWVDATFEKPARLALEFARSPE